MSNEQIKFIQGDVIFTRINQLPADLKQLDGRILQSSEVTGNYHQFTPESQVSIYAKTDVFTNNPHINTITPDEGKYLVVHDMATLFHDKKGVTVPNPNPLDNHKPFQLPAGTYKVSIVREYDYETRMSTRVQD